MKILLILLFANFAIAGEEGKLSNQSELVLITSTGNTNLETYNLKTKTNYLVLKNKYVFGGHYTLSTFEDEASGDDVESARNWDVHIKFERDINKKIGFYSQFQIEGDEFAGFKQRENLDLGAQYHYIKTEKKNFYSEFGVRYTIEKALNRNEDGDDIFNYNKGRVYAEYNSILREGLSIKYWLEYLPNFTDSVGYLISQEASVAFALSDKFSLNFAYKNNYNNNPGTNAAGNDLDKNDAKTTTSLIAKF